MKEEKQTFKTLKIYKMKKVLQLLNTLDKVEPITLDHKSIKNAGLDAMIKRTKLFYPELTIIYKPGKGFFSELKKSNPVT